MILRNLKNSPEKMIPVAMSLIVVGLSILAIGIAWPRFSPSHPPHRHRLERLRARFPLRTRHSP